MSQTKLTRREFLRVAGITAAGAVIASCAPAPTPAPTAAPPTAAPKPAATTAPAPAPTQPPAAKAPATIEFLAWGDTTDGPAWEKLKPAYEAKFAGKK